MSTTANITQSDDDVVQIDKFSSIAQYRGFLILNGYNVNSSCDLNTLKSFVTENAHNMQLFPRSAIPLIHTEGEEKCTNTLKLQQRGNLSAEYLHMEK